MEWLSSIFKRKKESAQPEQPDQNAEPLPPESPAEVREAMHEIAAGNPELAEQPAERTPPTPEAVEARHIMAALERFGHEPGHMGDFQSFGSGEHKLFIDPVVHVDYHRTPEGQQAEWLTQNYIVVTDKGLRLIQCERNDGGFNAAAEISKVLQQRRQTVDDNGDYPDIQSNIVTHGLDGDTITLGADTTEPRRRIAFGPTGYAVDGHQPMTGAKVIDIPLEGRASLPESVQKGIQNLGQMAPA